ncbi:S8 family peptidase [Arthrobacter sp. ISL-48]|uniref:S8 family peptidase n=1 Tax=Arthrobacter sp. ISL-48 TaxID=2819110 RepID=UPI001BEA14E7|nr:S8 family peptidase [Arthrobacter sp. ISL-48]MBT2534319.1 S8 family peptidase [Arthrobacter sp. ISL-48]
MAANSGSGGRIFVNGELLGEPVVRASGGGPKYHPRTFNEARAVLAPQVTAIRNQLADLDPALRVKKVVIEADVWANYLANSYFPSRLINQLKFAPLGSKVIDGILNLPSSGETPAPSKSFLLAVDEADLDALQELLRTGGNTKALQGAADELRQFTTFRLAEAHTNDSDGLVAAELCPYEAVLHPDPDHTTPHARAAASNAVLTKFTALVESVGGRVHSEHNDTVDGLTFVAVDIPPGQLAAVTAFNPLRTISPTPRIETLSGHDETIAPSEAVPTGKKSDRNIPEVLVFDGGVDATTPFFKDSVTAIDLTGKGITAGDAAHGSAVTAAVLYGDLGQGQAIPAPAANITHYQIFPGPKEDATEYPWILRQIREQVTKSEARIVNLSLGPRVATEDNEPHRWTAVLDKIAYERGVLFVTAAGNNGEKDASSGLNRVQVPGDMVNGLCVGACDNPEGNLSWRAAAYSGRGPGRPGARVQPGVVTHGGTRDDPFGRLRANGEIHYDGFGTSYAAPLATNVLARLVPELGPLADAPTLRALAAHFAENIDKHDVVEVGHGRLTNDVENLLNCTADEATTIYQGLLGRDEVLGFQLPYPESANSGTFDLRWTLAFTSATDSAEAGEYTNAGLEAKFRPHASRYPLRRKNPVTGKHETKVRHVRKDSKEIGDMVALGWIPGPNPATRQPKNNSAKEQTRRDQGKWESLWRAEDALQASSLEHPRIDISHVTREGGRITSDTEDIEFTLVVTVKSRKNLPVYSEVASQFTVLAPLPTVIPVEVEAEIENEVEVDL